ncbi:NFACT family protein [Paenibacillus sp. MBLB4367]|uniref:Rqc2 family fibronectin-binding protein n=1 Tax=Paenibacillus sp. MBLB4367 TaxID=3384767 RepID=UPI0039082245
MALDGLVIRAIRDELRACIGGRINKIHQPSDNDIVLHIRAQGQNLRLLLSASPTYPRVHLTGQPFVNPLEAPMFCMLLRKHCEGGVIETIEQVGMERILHISVRHRDELGDLSLKKIVVELMGRHSNIVLLDPEAGTIIDGIHHVTPAISSYRVIMPGSKYVAPPDQGKHDPLDVTADRFAELLSKDAETAEELEAEEDDGKRLAERLVALFSGISPTIAAEMAYRAANGGAGVSKAALWPVFQELMELVRERRYAPAIVTTPSGKSLFSIVALTYAGGEVRRFDSMFECLEAYYGDKAERDTVKQRMADLLKFLQNEKNKNVKKLEKLEETMEEAKDADRFRILGELVTASIHAIRKGDKQVETINYYDEEQRPVTIELDPLLSPPENAQRYFKKYTKGKNSLIAVREQLDSTHAEIQYLETVLQQIGHASLADIEEIREELVEQGYIRHRGKKSAKKKKNDKPVITCYLSSEGIPIYVGKNNTQNEYLTNRLAQSADTWLHTKDIPGSHVVIRSGTFGEATLNEAARLAAYYSQAKQSSQVPVDYTLIRHVRKPNGSKPGFVIYDHQKTLFVTPDEAAIKSLPLAAKGQ